MIPTIVEPLFNTDTTVFFHSIFSLTIKALNFIFYILTLCVNQFKDLCLTHGALVINLSAFRLKTLDYIFVRDTYSGCHSRMPFVHICL